VTDFHRLTADAISGGLPIHRIGRRVLVFDELDSTNTHALEQLRQSGREADGTVVFAEHQSAGRGRLGRKWQSPRGASLLMTALLVDDRARQTAPRSASSLALLVAVAVAEAIRASTDVEAVIRWPNDLYVEDRKLAGILIETRDWTNGLLATAIGVGVNCLQQRAHFPPDLGRPATSLDIESAKPVDRVGVARAILSRLDCQLSANDSRLDANADVHEKWKQLSNDIGQRVTLVESGIEYTGRILDLDPLDGLLLQLDTGARKAFHPNTTTRL